MCARMADLDTILSATSGKLADMAVHELWGANLGLKHLRNICHAIHMRYLMCTVEMSARRFWADQQARNQKVGKDHCSCKIAWCTKNALYSLALCLMCRISRGCSLRYSIKHGPFEFEPFNISSKQKSWLHLNPTSFYPQFSSPAAVMVASGQRWQRPSMPGGFMFSQPRVHSQRCRTWRIWKIKHS